MARGGGRPGRLQKRGAETIRQRSENKGKNGKKPIKADIPRRNFFSDKGFPCRINDLAYIRKA